MIIHKDIIQGSPEWFDLRLEKVTGSRLDKVFKATNLELIDALIAESETGQSADENDYISDAMQRGKDLESIALGEYSVRSSEDGIPVLVSTVGFIQSERWPLLGMSPDGIISLVGKNSLAVVETKCPSSKVHIKNIRQNQLPNGYKWQCLSPLLIGEEIEYVDFVSFDPRVAKKPYWSIRIMREEVAEDLAKAEIELDKFFEKLEMYRDKIMF